MDTRTAQRMRSAKLAGRGLDASTRAVNALTWFAILAASGLTIYNGLPILTDWYGASFVVERPDRTVDGLWRTALVCHIAASSVAIAIGPLLVWNLLLKKSRALHRRIGWVYVIGVLSVGAPTGFYLAFFSKGGVMGATGFLVTALVWLFVTLRGVHWIIRRKVRRHAAWMGRSYALTLSAVFFRFIQMGLYETSLEYEQIYVLSIWGSLVASLLLGEFFAAQLRREGLFCRLSFLPKVAALGSRFEGPAQRPASYATRSSLSSRPLLLDPESGR